MYPTCCWCVLTTRESRWCCCWGGACAFEIGRNVFCCVCAACGKLGDWRMCRRWRYQGIWKLWHKLVCRRYRGQRSVSGHLSGLCCLRVGWQARLCVGGRGKAGSKSLCLARLSRSLLFLDSHLSSGERFCSLCGYRLGASLLFGLSLCSLAFLSFSSTRRCIPDEPVGA